MTAASAEASASAAPAELAIDLMSGDFHGGDPYAAFAWMRANAPIYHDEANDLWAAATHQYVKLMGTDPSTFSNGIGGARPKFVPMPMMVDMDPPEHHRHRKIVSAGFTPRRIAAMEDHVRSVCDDVIDEVCERGSCDFVRDIAAQLPLNMIGDMLGVTKESRPDLLRWSEQMLESQGNPSEESMANASQAFAEYFEYMQPVLEERRVSKSEDDLIGILVNAEIDGDRLDADALMFESLLLLIGGDETTRHVLSGGMLALQEHPDQLKLLRDERERIPTAVEEMLRWVSPIKNMVRTTTRDVEVGGVTIPDGAQIMLLYPSANRDETVFDDPDVFDVTRDPNPHVAFGFGSHFCLGNQLARIELRVMFDRLFTRLPDLALAAPGPFPQRAPRRR